LKLRQRITDAEAKYAHKDTWAYEKPGIWLEIRELTAKAELAEAKEKTAKQRREKLSKDLTKTNFEERRAKRFKGL
jgi:hypothetical protein